MLHESANSTLPDRTQPTPTLNNPTYPTEPDRVESVDWALVYRISSNLTAISAAGWCICSPLHYLHLPKDVFIQIAFNDLPFISISVAFAVTVTLFPQPKALSTMALAGAVVCALVI